jgi:copper(I)-binding protein
MRRFNLAFSLLLVAIWMCSCGPSNKSIKVTNAWARPAQAGDNGAVYFVIENNTGQADDLLSGASEVAQAVELHMSSMDSNGTMTMEHQMSVPVPDRGKVEFKPGGLHVMLVNLSRELKVGDQFPLTLKFNNTGEMTLQVVVKAQ